MKEIVSLSEKVFLKKNFKSEDFLTEATLYIEPNYLLPKEKIL